jgi:glycosyltransferase involved in cell wall biosynthesis
MKIVLVGPGIIPIPPTGWGALEILIWDTKQYLEKECHHEVIIVNTPNINDMIRQINQEKADIVHIHYDVFWNIIPQLTCKNIIITSHYGYIEQKNVWFPGYHTVFNGFLSLKNVYIHCLSPGIKQVYLDHGCDHTRLITLPNGANDTLFKYNQTALLPDRSIYLGKIEPRKRQAIYQSIPIIDFVGNCVDHKFNTNNPNYLREWSKSYLYENLTHYANLVLLSDGEAHPLVITEALICGLGVVVSEYAAANLDRDKPFITVIPTDKLNDLAYVTKKILDNQKTAIQMRDEIRSYGLNKFSWQKIIHDYNNVITNIISPSNRKLKIAMIGPASPIPPVGWGAVESLIWDYKLQLEKRNIDVLIINYNESEKIINHVNSFAPDIVHIMYDDFYYLWDAFHCKKVILTSHYAYIDTLPQRTNDHYWTKFNGFVNSKAKIQALSPSVKDMYMKYGVTADRINIVHNGANQQLFKYTPIPTYTNRSIYLAKIDYRKRQHIYQTIPHLYFAGNIADHRFNRNNPNYLGEWTKDYLYQHLTEYPNLVLLSDGEVHPLVVCEAMLCGLGLVLSKYAAANLDITLPWIDIIPDEKLNDIAYVSHIIKENRTRAIEYREDIRAYALKYFTWDVIIDKYLQLINHWFPEIKIEV